MMMALTYVAHASTFTYRPVTDPASMGFPEDMVTKAKELIR